MIFIGLGSNIGDREMMLQRALKEISAFSDIVGISRIYETKPWGNPNQANFLNMAIAIQTMLTPAETLIRFHAIEEKLGRIRYEKWGARNIDIDIILWNNLHIDNEFLTIPHKYLKHRDFFLKPCVDIQEDVKDPISNEKFCDILSKIDRKARTIIGVIDA